MTKLINLIKRALAFFFLVEEPAQVAPAFQFFRSYAKIKRAIESSYNRMHIVSCNDMIVEFDLQWRGKYPYFGEYLNKLISAKETQRTLIELNLITQPTCEA